MKSENQTSRNSLTLYLTNDELRRVNQVFLDSGLNRSTFMRRCIGAGLSVWDNQGWDAWKKWIQDALHVENTISDGEN